MGMMMEVETEMESSMVKRRENYSANCGFCDLVLVGREQFIGHMIHSHDLQCEQAGRLWRALEERRGSISQQRGFVNLVQSSSRCHFSVDNSGV
ncbi:hypothetical protein NVIE_023930 [Nitrososphaera viennensis EN76]|uniref:Uncharacterized protein n=1 Tax=Nitrososphaera viennensis EN76 TaxID=926571 RepID=A0A060HJA9_9ARCH|nr:hypothetical protein NVIE_023930 [Nitrososphaera viennensis EN76]